MRWNREERAFAVEAYFSNHQSVIATQRSFRTHFNVAPRGPVPDRKSIIARVKTFRETGSTTQQIIRIARRVRTPENIEAVRTSILQSPQRSVRKHASALALSARSVRRNFHEDLNFHPYKITIVQELSVADFTARRNACEALLENIAEDAIVYFSDEAHFHLSGSVNRQNMRYWSDTNPQKLHQKPISERK
ncbi:Transposable element Tc3 transposase [Caligus rogercresseyi]|uniref:Transposable element Tc3 transposase n=1 Tax=Caligus rogercresseyi TaxID=217165 RepID=A0A7T8K984_CALRO|nr:Transposable element Tc3 transposase [Caligus rogercresseyi]